jgi:hypothetical protein
VADNTRCYEVRIPVPQQRTTWRSNVELTDDEAHALRMHLVTLEADGKIGHDWYVYDQSSQYNMTHIRQFFADHNLQ